VPEVSLIFGAGDGKLRLAVGLRKP